MKISSKSSFQLGEQMESYWRVQEVAEALQISEQTVYRYVANDEIPYHKNN